MSLTFKKTMFNPSTELLVGGLCGDWNHGIWWLSIQLGINNHPNWRTPSFFRGVGIPPTSYRLMAFPPRDLSKKHRVFRDPTETEVQSRVPAHEEPMNLQALRKAAEDGDLWLGSGRDHGTVGGCVVGFHGRLKMENDAGRKAIIWSNPSVQIFFSDESNWATEVPCISGTAERWGFKLYTGFGSSSLRKMDETSKLVVETE